MTRRGLLLGAGGVAGGGLVFGFASLGAAQSGVTRRAADLVERDGARLLAGWVAIAPDDTTTVIIPHAEMGQGVSTALPMMLAEELDADWSKVRALAAPADEAFVNWFLAEAATLKDGAVLRSGAADPIFKIIARQIGLQMTAGSTAVYRTGEFGMRRVGAGARRMLLAAAAARWGVPLDSLTTRDSVVIHAATGRRLRYGELAEAAATKRPPARPPLKPRDQYRLIGRAIPRLDIPAKVTGDYDYAIDLRLPAMRYATAKAAPVHGGRLVAVDDAPARAVAGVEHVVKLDDAVVVVARKPWQALTGLAALAPRFSDGGAGEITTASLYADQIAALDSAARQRKLKVGEAAEALARAERKVEAVYRAPFLHHAQMEPINAIGQFQGDRLTVWSGVQDPYQTRKHLAALAGLPMSQVSLHPMPLGGSFGRKTGPGPDAIYYPQLIAAARAAAPNPVKLIWTREEDTTQGSFRPLTSTRMTAGLGADGLPVAWLQVFTRGRDGRSIAYPLPYETPNQLMEQVDRAYHVRDGALRSVNQTQHVFWRESFVDELAHAAGRDPLDYRLAMLKDPRARRVLQEAAARAGWGQPLPEGAGRGIALSVEFGSYVAEVVEASYGGGGVKVLRATAVVDCGQVVHPDTAAQQVEGGLIMGLSNAVAEEITIENGAVAQRLFTDYPIFTLADTPPIEVHFLESDGPVGGLGEVGVPPAAPALANALFAATGRRARQTPLNSALASAEMVSSAGNGTGGSAG